MLAPQDTHKEGLGDDEDGDPHRSVQHWEARTPLEQAVEQYHDRIPMRWKREFLLALRQSLLSLGEVVVSSACSGCDIVYIACCQLATYWSSKLDIPVTMRHGFVCERDSAKQKFLQSQFQAQLFSDVTDLVKPRAHELVSNTTVCIPSCTLFTAGFSCKSRSPLNNKRSSFKHCLQENNSEAETTHTFEYTYGYIKEHSPPIVVLENVTSLLEKEPGRVDKSDAEFVQSELQKAGYHVVIMKFDAESFGSRASRSRLYFLAWHVGVDMSSPPSSLARKLEESLQCLWEVHQASAIEAMPAEKFMNLAVPEEEAGEAREEEPKMQKQSQDPKWKAEHCEAFRSAGCEA